MLKSIYMTLGMLCGFALVQGAADEDLKSGTTTLGTNKLEISDCFTIKMVRIPCSDNPDTESHCVPIIVWKKICVKRNVNEGSTKKHFARDGSYSYLEVQGWIGFVEGHDRNILTKVVVGLPAYLEWQKSCDAYFDEAKKLQDAWSRCRENVGCISAIAEPKISMRFYNNDFDNSSIVAPCSMHEAFEENHLNVNDEKHVKVMEGYARSCVSSRYVQYLVLNTEKEHAFLRQEKNGERIERKKKLSLSS